MFSDKQIFVLEDTMLQEKPIINHAHALLKEQFNMQVDKREVALV